MLPIMQPKPKFSQSARRLTPRELQILPLLHMTNEEIGQELGTSRHTVRQQVARLLCKLGLRNRTAAAAWWAERCTLISIFQKGRGASASDASSKPTLGVDPAAFILQDRGKAA